MTMHGLGQIQTYMHCLSDRGTINYLCNAEMYPARYTRTIYFLEIIVLEIAMENINRVPDKSYTIT